MENLIFLDLDGVLNISEGPNATYLSKFEHFERKLIQNLNNILLNSNINIIISSSWRNDFEDMLFQLELSGFDYKERIVGITPFLEFRGEEILKWIEDNNFNGKYLCVDDNIKQIYKQGKKKVNKNFCLEINPKEGLIEEKAKKILEYFIQQ